MKGFLKELQESNATGAVQVVKTLSGSVKQPELDGYADRESCFGRRFPKHSATCLRRAAHR